VIGYFIAYMVHALVSVFAVMNPLGTLPTFIALTNGYSVTEQRHTARKAIFASFFILLLFLLLGHFIFQLFGITIAAFRVAGGILIFGIAYNLLNAKPSHIQSPYAEESVPREDIAVTPLAIPIVAGPGTIATVMALATGSNPVLDSVSVFAAFVIVLIATYFIFYYSSWFNKRLKPSQLNVITRLMGLILSIVAVQMAAAGFAGLFPGWMH
jgi:multiple antibiotic resistance protein